MGVGESGTSAAALEAEALCDDPSGFFGQSHTAMQTIPRDRLAALQLEAVKFRFAQLRDRIPMLKKLADNQDVATIETIDDIVPLLFEHTMYKAYPPSLLETGRFADINRFLGKLTTVDLSGIDVSECKTIDDWMETMDRESPLLIIHSSGTSGTMSFLPVSKREWDKLGASLRVTCLQKFGDAPRDDEGDIWAIYPYFRHGGSGHIRQCELFVKYFTGGEDRLITAYPGRMSSDLLYLGAKIRSAAAKGTVGQLKIAPAMLARKAEYEKLQAEMPQHLENFFRDLAVKLKGKRIFFSGAMNLIYKMCELGKEKGLTQVFAPNSVISTGGDSKDGSKMPDDWREQVCAFVGIESTLMCYGMSEVCGLHYKCEHKHYHFVPWVIPFVLDPDTSEVLPRSGRQTGRAAFFDLGAETRWGGFITGDEISVEWDEPCPCGRTSVYAMDGIQRISDKKGDDKITCAATEGAHKDAMSFLTSF